MAKHEIAPRQAWQNSGEALFGVQRQMTDWGFAHAGFWSELLAVHDLWVADEYDQDHFAREVVSAYAEPGASPTPRSAPPDGKQVSGMSWRGVRGNPSLC